MTSTLTRVCCTSAAAPEDAAVTPRPLVMPAVVASSLRAQRTAHAADRLRLGAAYAGSGLVLARSDG